MQNSASVIHAPITLQPLIVPRVWGGDRLNKEFERSLPDQPVGESWEIHGELKVTGSELTLDQLVAQFGQVLLGTAVNADRGFPLLTKWLDCREWLSVQVHPDDALAQEFTGDEFARGKTEAWYVFRAEPEAELIHGLKEGVLFQQLEDCKNEEILGFTQRVRSQAGQLFHTPAGVVHALGPGNLIYEIQQSCDLTYRFYDWGRDRELHFERALDCVKRAETGPAIVSARKLQCPYFTIELLSGSSDWQVSKKAFQLLACTSTGAVVDWFGGSILVAPGNTILLPAGLGDVRLTPSGGEPVLKIGIPEETP